MLFNIHEYNYLGALIEMNCEEVVNLYLQTGSIRATAKKMNISESKVRRVLVVSGVYCNNMSVQISEMFEQGKSVSEIASAIGVTKSCVHSYLPYSRVVYNLKNPSENALAIRRYRNNKKISKNH